MLRENIKRWEQEFFQQGFQQGLQQVRDQRMLLGEIKIMKLLLQKRFGPASPEVSQKLHNASKEEIEEWSIRILEAKTIDDVFKS